MKDLDADPTIENRGELMPTRAKKDNDAQVVALTTGFHNDEQGHPVRIVEGDRLRADSPVVLRNPHLFCDAGLTTQEQREAAAALVPQQAAHRPSHQRRQARQDPHQHRPPLSPPGDHRPGPTPRTAARHSRSGAGRGLARALSGHNLEEM